MHKLFSTSVELPFKNSIKIQFLIGLEIYLCQPLSLFDEIDDL